MIGAVRQRGRDRPPGRDVDVAAGPDLLTGGAPHGEGLRERWAAQPSGRRRALASAAAVVGAAALVTGTLVAGRGYLAERELRQQVSVEVGLDVLSDSNAPLGGRVDYFATVRNTGPRQLEVRGVRFADAGLRVRHRNDRTIELDPGQTARVRLSVVADCPLGAPAGPGLRGALTVVPESGDEREVDVVVADAELIVGMVGTLCRVLPELRGRELSGPVLD